MGDKCNCYRFSPRDSLSGAVAQIADYLSKHPGWNETELRAFVDGLISSAGVETFNGRSGNVTLNKDDVNNLLIANCYFAEADETIESIDVLALYKLGIRIIFTQYSSEVDGYTLAYGIEYYPATDTAKAYLFSSGSGGAGAVVSVNGKTGTVVLKASDILMNNGDSVENAVSNTKAIANAAYSPDNPPPYPVNSVNSKTGSVMLKVVDVSNGDSVDDNAYIFIDETENYPDIIAPDSNKLGGQIPSYYATAESVNSLKNDKLDKTATAADSAKLGGKTLAEIMLDLYPVGAVYISVNSTSPASLFGGTWEQIEDRFLLAAGSTYAAGSTGGEATHTLKESELPNITGTVTSGSGAGGGSTSTGYGNFRSVTGVFTTSLACMYTSDAADKNTWPSSATSYQKISMSFGGGASHNNMPPYLAVYMWERVS